MKPTNKKRTAAELVGETANLVLPYGDPTGFLKAKELLSLILVAEIGTRANFIKTGKHTPSLPPDANHPAAKDLNAKESVNMVRKMRAIYFDKQDEWEKEGRLKCRAVIMKSLTDEGREAVMQDSAYTEADESNDPLEMWKIIVRLHSHVNHVAGRAAMGSDGCELRTHCMQTRIQSETP